MTKNEKIILTLILLLTLAARLYYIYTSPLLKFTHDEIGYYEMVLRFFEKGYFGYYSLGSNAYITPGYPVFLMGVYLLADLLNSGLLITVRTIQVIISVGSVFLVYLIGRKSGGRPVATLAAVLAAIYPSSFMANNRILTEVLYIFLLLGYIYSVIIAFEKQGLARHALSGALMGLAVLVRPAVAPFLAVPFLVQFIARRDLKILPGLLAAILAFSVVMSPWWIRNYLVFDKFIVFATQTGDPVLRGTDPYDVYDRFGPSIIKNVPRSQRANLAVERIKEGFKNDPVLWTKWFTVGKFSYMWFKPWGMLTGWSKALHFWVFVVIGWTGVFVNLFDRYLRWPALMVIAITLLQLLFIPIERYIYPLTPVMAVMAAVIIVKIGQKILDTVYLNR